MKKYIDSSIVFDLGELGFDLSDYHKTGELPRIDDVVDWLYNVKRLYVYSEPFHQWVVPNRWSFNCSILKLDNDYDKSQNDVIYVYNSSDKFVDSPYIAMKEGIRCAIDYLKDKKLEGCISSELT